MSADFTPEKEDYKILTPFKMQVLTNFPYIEADFDALTNYQLLCKVVEYLNDVIHNENEITEEVNGLYNAYVSLQNYVNNYFDNLDVQDEINNKLDDMAESGQLTDIIAQYLGLAGMITYNTVAEMKLADNLVNGSKCCTLGYYSINDGGKSIYKVRNVTNQDVVDEMLIIALYDNNLVAELVSNDEVNLKQLGAKGNDTQDDTNYFKKACENFKIVRVTNGTYKITSNCIITNKVEIIGDSNSVLHFTAGTENLGPNTNGKVNLKNIKISSSNGICYHINRTGVIDTIIENNNITATSYGILVNANTDDGKNLIITNNKIESSSDCIEVNTTSSNDNKFKNIIITNNILKQSGGSGSSSGFAIGIAKGRQVNVENNIIDGSRLEAIHVEDVYERINIIGNTISNCLSNGIQINTISGYNERCNVSNNIIKGNKASGKYGIYLTSNTAGASDNYMIENCIISNFDRGIYTSRLLNCHNITIENCNIALSGGFGNIKGNIKLINTPVIINYNGAEIKELEDVELTNIEGGVDPTTFITSTGTGTIIFNKLKYEVELPITSTESSRVIKFLKVPTYFDGIIVCDINTGTANYGHSISKVNYASGTLTKETLSYKNYGNFSNSDRIEATDDGFLSVRPTNSSQASGKMTLRVELIGTLIIKGTYN